MGKFQTAITRHQWPQKQKRFCQYCLFGETKRSRHISKKWICSSQWICSSRWICSSQCILYKYITQLAQKTMSTKLVIHPARGLPPARTLITNFVLSLFSGVGMLYIYIIYIYIYIYIHVNIAKSYRTRLYRPTLWSPQVRLLCLDGFLHPLRIAPD